MRTEITIPIAFDTKPIEQMLQEHGMDEVKSAIRDIVEENIVNQVPKKGSYYGNSKEPDWTRLLRTLFTDWLDNNRDEIIDEASLLMAQRAAGTKKWRDVLKEVKDVQ